MTSARHRRPKPCRTSSHRHQHLNHSVLFLVNVVIIMIVIPRYIQSMSEEVEQLEGLMSQYTGQAASMEQVDEGAV